MAASYKPAVYRTSGGDQISVASSGNIAVASGGAITFASGGTLSLTGQAITSTGTITGNQYVTKAIAAASSGSTGFASYGITRIYSCGVSTGHLYTMGAAAAAGVEKYICCAEGAVSTSPAAVTMSGTLIAGLTNIIFSSGTTGAVQWVHLMAENTTNWFVLGLSTDVTFS